MTMPTDVALAVLCAQIYQPGAVVGFDYYDAGMDDGICWALKRFPGYDVVVFRGSLTLQDWICDFRALAMPTRIGHVHDGFYSGMEKMWSEAKPMLQQPAIVTGHSLGAARADVLAALMTIDAAAPLARVVMGEPKPGLIDFALRVPGGGRSYRNGNAVHHDIVTDLPFSFPPEQYVHPTPVIPVTAEPDNAAFATDGIFAYHRVGLYQKAIADYLNRPNANGVAGGAT